MKKQLTLVLGLLVSPVGAANTFDITLNYTGDQSYLPAFRAAEAIWEGIIPSYIDGNWNKVPDFFGITIAATIGAIDGVGGSLGSAGPTLYAVDDLNYALATNGTMNFDVADVGGLGPNLTTLILHEMAHVIGLGTLWRVYDVDTDQHYNNLYTDGSGQYTGANGLAAYQTEFGQPGAMFVPVELGGENGTYDRHWNEVDSGAGLTGLVSSISGSDMSYELMTGWQNTDQPYFISNLTRGSLRDLGYDVALVPETSSVFLVAMTFSSLLLRRRTR